MACEGMRFTHAYSQPSCTPDDGQIQLAQPTALRPPPEGPRPPPNRRSHPFRLSTGMLIVGNQVAISIGDATRAPFPLGNATYTGAMVGLDTEEREAVEG